MTSLTICCRLTKDFQTNLLTYVVKNAWTAFDDNEVVRSYIQQRITNLTTNVERPGAMSQTLSDW